MPHRSTCSDSTSQTLLCSSQTEQVPNGLATRTGTVSCA